MAASDARYPPRKNEAYRLTFGLYDGAGQLVSAAASLDSERSLDGGAFSDCTSEATEIGSTGYYTLDLTAAEMNADTVLVQVKSTTAETAVFVIHPQVNETVLVRTTIATLTSQTSFTLTASSADNDAYNGCVIVVQDAATAVQKAVGVVSDYTGATKTITLLTDPAVFTMAAGDYVTIFADRALKPTVDNRTLDVSSTGEAGLDWANVGSQSTSVNFSATTVNLVNTLTTYTGNTPQTGDAFARLGAPAGVSVSADIAGVQSDTNDIQTRLPAALVSGRMDSSAGAMAAGVITAASFAAGAIDAAAIAADAIGASEFAQAAADKIWSSATRTLTAFSFGVSLSTLESAVLHSGTAQAGAATTITLAAGASATNDLYVGNRVKVYGGTGAGQTRTVTAYNGTTKVATVDRAWTTNPDATSTYGVVEGDNPDLDASLQVARVTLVDALTTYTGDTPQTGDAFARLGAPAGASVSADIAGVQSDTNDIQTRLPAALVSGRMDASVGAMAANVVTAAAIATDAIDSDAIAASAVTEIQAGLSTATAAQIADAVWDEAIADHLTAGSTGAKLNTAASAADPLLNLVPGTYASGTAGAAIGKIGSGQIVTVNPLSQNGLRMSVVKGDDYSNTDARAFDWVDSSAAWPDLTGATITFNLYSGLATSTVAFTKAGSVVTATGSNKKVRVEFTAANTASFPAGGNKFEVVATLSSARVVTLVRGHCQVLEP